MSLDEARENDVVKEIEGITFLIEKNLYRAYEGVKIDYSPTLFKKGLIITPKGARGGCYK